MVDFTNGSFVKLRKIPNENCFQEIMSLLVPDEKIIGVYAAMRDGVVFTDKRVISMNVQGLTGKKVSYFSYPYSKVQYYGIQTAGLLDIDSELILAFNNGAVLQFDFKTAVDITMLNNLISKYVL